MDANFWHQKWERGEIGFHQPQVNTLLAEHFSQLSLPSHRRVFLPLCGKTLDIAWLLDQGYRVAGAELSEMAVRELFQSLGITPMISGNDALTHFSAPAIDVYVGDIFALSSQQLGAVDAIYDRAALVALPSDMRMRYAAHLVTITHAAPQLLISFEYEQSLIDGPPFSVTAAEIHQHYDRAYDVRLLESREVEGGLKGKIPATEACWALQPRS